MNRLAITKRLTTAGITLGQGISVEPGASILVRIEDGEGGVDYSATDAAFDKVREVFPACQTRQYASGEWMVWPNHSLPVAANDTLYDACDPANPIHY